MCVHGIQYCRQADTGITILQHILQNLINQNPVKRLLSSSELLGFKPYAKKSQQPLLRASVFDCLRNEVYTKIEKQLIASKINLEGKYQSYSEDMIVPQLSEFGIAFQSMLFSGQQEFCNKNSKYKTYDVHCAIYFFKYVS